MEDTAKKISFGFNKSIKKLNLNGTGGNKPSRNNIQLIDCLEGQSIKVKNPVIQVKAPLVIPINESTSLVTRIKNTIEKREAAAKLNHIQEKPDSELTLDEIAAKELLKDAQNLDSNKTTTKVYELPHQEEKLLIEGEPESTLEDYENVPIGDFGLAMLRGMGWKEGMGIGKNQKSCTTKEPSLRPKGMGLGANKLALKAPNAINDKDGNELILKKGSFGKINNGKHKGSYCEVQGFDDEAGRVIVKLALNGLVLSVNEFLVTVVTKEDFAQNSKVINQTKFEEYKNKDGESSKILEKHEDKKEKHKSRSKEHKKHKKSHKKHRKNRSSSSDSENNSKHRKRSRHRKD